MIDFKRLFGSFKFAGRGFLSVLQREQNFRLHLLAALGVIFLGIYFQIKLWQWALLVLMISAVFVLELLNTAVERLVDMLEPKVHHYVEEIKDIMSAVVLVVAVTSILIGLIIFLPYF